MSDDQIDEHNIRIGSLVDTTTPADCSASVADSIVCAAYGSGRYFYSQPKP